MKQKKIQKKTKKIKQNEAPSARAEWLYMADAGVSLRCLYELLRKEEWNTELWEEADVLEIMLPGAGAIDMEYLEEEQWEEALFAQIRKHQTEKVYTVTFAEEDYGQVQEVMKYLTEQAGGLFCRDTEDFFPQIRGR